jgi:predicted esterase YcpF (UPF0227 family)
MNIIYIHGFGSRVNLESEKYQALGELGIVFPVAPDYSVSYEENFALVKRMAESADLLVGTSMGGYLASRVAADTGLPFVAINPVLLPKRTLNKYLGTREDYYGRTYTLLEETVKGYPVFAPGNNGLILLDLGDELIDAHETAACLEGHMSVYTFAGGSHRFSHVFESISIIQKFLDQQREHVSAECEILPFEYPSAELSDIQVLKVNTEDEDIQCPVCHEIVLEQTTPELRDEPPEPCPCPHVKFLFLDNGWPDDISSYELIDANVAEWLELQLAFGNEESSELDRASDILLKCPLVTHVVEDKPTLPAPFYRVLWGFSQ